MKLTKSSRAFRRATAFVLAAALTLSAPVATNASAASKKVPSLSVKKKTLYYNKAGKKSFTLKVKKNKVKKIVKTKWTTSKKSVAKLSSKKKTQVKVLAKKKGTAKITAKVTYKAGSKTKTKKLVCKVTSKKAKAPVKTKEPVVTPSSTATTTEAPTQAPSEAPSKDPVKTDAPSAEPTATAEPTDAPVDSTATASSITAIEVDGNNFQFSVLLENGKNNEAAVKNAKLELKKDSITATASFKEMDGANSAIFKIDDSKVLTPGDRSADGKYGVTSKSKSLTLAKDAYTTYEEAIDALAVEGFVTTPVYNWNNTVIEKYAPIEGASITLIENGKTVKTDAKGYYKLTTSSGKKTLKIEKDDYISQITPADHVTVNKSHLTSQNFVLAKFDQEKVKVSIKVLDGETEKEIPDATVQILDATGNTVNGADKKKTDTHGRSIFVNHKAFIANDGTELDTTVVDGNTVPNPDFYDRTESCEPNFFERGKTYKVKVSKGLSWKNLTQDRTGTEDNGVYEDNIAEVTINTKHTYDVTVRLRPIKELPSLKVTQEFDEDTAEGDKAPNNKMTAEEIADAQDPAKGGDPTVYEIYTEYELYADYTGDGIADELANYSGGNANAAANFEGVDAGTEKGTAAVVNGQFTSKINKDRKTTIDLLDPNGDGDNADNLLGLGKGTNVGTGKPCLPNGTYYLLLRSYTASDYTTATDADFAVTAITVKEGEACAVNVVRRKAVAIELTTSLDPDKATGDAQGNAVATGDALQSVRWNSSTNLYELNTNDDHRVYTQNTLYRKIGNMLIKVENSEAVYPYDSSLSTKPYSDLTLVYGEKDVFVAGNEYTHLTLKEDYVVRTKSNYAVADDKAVNVKDNKEDTIALNPRFRIRQIEIKKQDGDALLEDGAVRKISKIRVLNSAGKELSVRNYNVWSDDDDCPSDGSVPADEAFALFNDPNLKKELFVPDLDNKVKIEVTLKDCNPVTSDEINITDLQYLDLKITQKVTPVTGLTKLSGTVTVNKKDGTTAKDFANAGANLVQVMLYDSDKKIVAFGKTANPKNGVTNYTVEQGSTYNKEMKAGTYTLVARGYRTETLVTTVTLEDQKTVTKDLVLDEGGQGSAKIVSTDTNKNPIEATGCAFGLNVAAYDENYVRYFVKGSWKSGSVYADDNALRTALVAAGFDEDLAGRYEGIPETTQDNNSTMVTSKTEDKVSNLSVGSYTLHFWETDEFDSVNDAVDHPNQTLVLSTNGESKRPEYEFTWKQAAPGGKVRLTVNQPTGRTFVSRVVLAKPLDADGKELDQIEDLIYVGGATGTYVDKDNNYELIGANKYGQNDYTVLKVNPHRAYNVYVYDFTGAYVVKQMKNVEGVDAEMTIDYTASSHD